MEIIFKNLVDINTGKPVELEWHGSADDFELTRVAGIRIAEKFNEVFNNG